MPGLVKEVARKQQTQHKDHQQAQKQGRAVELYGLLIGIWRAFHGFLLSLDKLHCRDRPQEKHAGHPEGMDGQPAYGEDRVGNLLVGRIALHRYNQKSEY